jgi:hypothetical protein
LWLFVSHCVKKPPRRPRSRLIFASLQNELGINSALALVAQIDVAQISGRSHASNASVRFNAPFLQEDTKRELGGAFYVERRPWSLFLIVIGGSRFASKSKTRS